MREKNEEKEKGKDKNEIEVEEIMMEKGLKEGIVSEMKNKMREDIDKWKGGNMEVNGKKIIIKLVEMIKVWKMRKEVGIGDKKEGGVIVSEEKEKRIERMKKKGLVVVESIESGEDEVEIVKCEGREENEEIEKKLMRKIGKIGVEIVNKNKKRRLGKKDFGIKLVKEGDEKLEIVM